MFSERLFPVCSPALLKRHPIHKPEDLLNAPLLRHTALPWSAWFRAMGLDTPNLPPSLGFDDTSMMLDAAAQGLGVALARSGLSERDIRDGRLVRPLAGEVDVDTGHHFVWRADNPKQARILALRDWFLKETERDRAG
jgi:LysR family glycine cleavage system transcriptional activator